MSAELALVPLKTTGVSAWLEIVGPAAELAKQIAATEFVPKAMRGNPAVVTACILFGAEIGIGPMQSLAKIAIVEGKPAPAAELARALLLAEGHDMWIEEATSTRVVLGAKRANSEHVQKITWSLDDAKKAGLAGKTNWQRYPRQMLLARASAELARMIAPDALGGISVFAEELDGDIDAPGDVAETAAAAAPAKRTRKLASAPALPAPAADEPPLPGEETAADDEDQSAGNVEPAAPPLEEEPPLPGEEPFEPGGEPLISQPQVRKLMATYGDLEVKDRAHQKRLSAQLLGFPIESHSKLTMSQASTLIDMLTALSSTDIVWGEDGPSVDEDGAA